MRSDHFALPFFVGFFVVSCTGPLAAQNLPSYVPTDGLVSWHPLDGNALDAIGAHNGSIYGGAGALNSIGESNASIELYDGNYINLGIYSELWGACEFSAAIWIRESVIQTGGGCCNAVWSSGFDQWLLWTGSWNSGLYFDSGLQCAGVQLRYPENTPGQWQHIVTRFANGEMQIWRNGILVASTTNNQCFCSHSGSMTLGTMDGFPHNFEGVLDDFGVWNRALSAFEVQALFLRGVPLAGCTAESACNFNEGANFDDGSCLFPGCIDPIACNFSEFAGCGDGSCDYSCCPGPGCCALGTHWSPELMKCEVDEVCAGDLDFDGAVATSDLLGLLNLYGLLCED
jgi:hypothetical protein